ncbi:MAG: hypothetical protein ACXAB7_12550 [Candidatus Kariarchaeaceae archaeon]|jgi:hypothetical protein
MFTLKLSDWRLHTLDSVGINEFNKDRDATDWIELFSSEFGLETSEVKLFLDNLLQLEDLLTHIVLRKESVLVGTAAVRRDRSFTNTGNIIGIFGKDEHSLQLIIAQLVKICQSNGIEILQMQFTHLKHDDPQILLYEELGFERKKSS